MVYLPNMPNIRCWVNVCRLACGTFCSLLPSHFFSHYLTVLRFAHLHPLVPLIIMWETILFGKKLPAVQEISLFFHTITMFDYKRNFPIKMQTAWSESQPKSFSKVGWKPAYCQLEVFLLLTKEKSKCFQFWDFFFEFHSKLSFSSRTFKSTIFRRLSGLV